MAEASEEGQAHVGLSANDDDDLFMRFTSIWRRLQ
jgi:hypothetical protein